MADIDFRIRIFKHDADWAVATTPEVDYTFLSGDIANLDEYGGQIIRPLEGRAEVRPWTVTLLDSADQITSKLSDADGYPDLESRLIDVSESIDGGAYTVRATGRIEDVQLDGMNAYNVSVVDELTTLRGRPVFQTADTTSIYPGGFMQVNESLVGGEDWVYGGQFECVAIDNNVARLRRKNATASSRTAMYVPPEEVYSAIRSDLTGQSLTLATTETTGPFDTLRALISSRPPDTNNFPYADHEIRGFDSDVGVFFGLSVQNSGVAVFPNSFEFTDLYWALEVFDPGATLTLNSFYYINIYMPGAAPTETIPGHIATNWGEGAKDRMQVVKDVFDEANMRYDSSRFVQYGGANPDGLLNHPRHPPIYKRLTGPADNAMDFLVENVFSILGYVPFIKANGEVDVRYVRMPDEGTLSDINTLPLFDSSTVSGEFPSWVLTDREAINEVEFKVQNLSQKPKTILENEWEDAEDDEDPNWRPVESGMDGLEGNSRTYVRNYARADKKIRRGLRFDFGDRYHQDNTSLNKYFDNIANEIFNRIGDGTIVVELTALPTMATVEPGEWVRVDLDDLPNLVGGGQRGGTRIMQVIEKWYTPGGPNFRLWDAGVASQPMAAPSISAVQNSSVPKHWIDVTVSGTTGDWWEIEANIAGAEPPEDDPNWFVAFTASSIVGFSGAFDTTINVKELPSGSTVWFRARQGARERITSDYSTAVSASTASLSTLTGLGENAIDDYTTELFWSAGDAGYPVEVQLMNSAGTNVLETWSLPAPTATATPTKHIVQHDQGATHTWRVRSYDEYGGVGAWATDSFTAGSGATGTSPDIRNVFVRVGNLLGTQ